MREDTHTMKHILIIDRGDNWRRFAVKTLSQEGFNTTERKTYDIPNDDKYDLIVLGCDDIGDEEVKLIHDARISEHIIVVAAMDGHRFSAIRRGFLSGAHDVLVKPLGCKSLLENVKDSLYLGEAMTVVPAKAGNESA
jgi:DNA-binding response OmpR family regulator